MATEFINGQWRIPNSWNVDESNQNKISNYSMDFNGVDGNINLGAGSPFNFNNAAGDLPFSFSMWFNIRDYGDIPNASGLFAKNAELTSQQYRVLYFSSKLRLMIAPQGTGSGESFIEQTNTWEPDANQWYHLVFTYDGRGGNNSASGLKMYIDKVEQTVSITQGSYDNMITTTAPLVIGSRSNNQNYTKGSFDLFSVFDYELTQAQINTLYGDSAAGYFQVGNPMALTPNPVAFYPLGDQDLIGAGNYNGVNWLVPNQVAVAASRYVFNFTGTNWINLGVGTLPFNANVIDFSVSCWVKSAQFGVIPSNFVVFSNGFGNIQGGINLGSTDSNVTLTLQQVSGARAVNIATSNFFTTNWNHVLVTVTSGGLDADRLKVYVNGNVFDFAMSDSPVKFPELAINQKPFTIGSRNGVIPTVGEFSNFSTFNKTLTAAEAAIVYNNGSPNDISSLSPVGWWKLNSQDTFDGTDWTIKDYAGSNDGTSVGMTSANLVLSDLPSATAGYSPYAIELDGIDEFFTVNNSNEKLNPDFISISAWFYPKSFTNNASIISSPNVATGYHSYNIDLKADGTLDVILRTGPLFAGGSLNYEYNFAGAGALNLNQWNFICMTYDGANVKVTVNTASESDPHAPLNGGALDYSIDPGGDINIGKRSGLNFVIDGILSNLAMFSTGLSDAQVSTIYNNGIPSDISSLNPLAWWELGSMMGFNGVNTYTALSNTDSNFAAISSANMEAVDVVNGPGYSDGGIGTSSLVIEKQAPYSFNNALSEGMAISNRDDSQASDSYPFIFELDLSAQSNPFTWNSPNMATINLFPFTVDWGDGTVEEIEASDLVNLKLQHIYDTSAYPRPVIQYGRADDFVRLGGELRMQGAAGTQPAASSEVIRSLKQIGRVPWRQFRLYDWKYAISQTQSSDIPDLSNVTNLGSCFHSNFEINQANIGQWDMSTIRTATNMFYQNKKFNQDLNTWDTSSLRGDNIAGMNIQTMFNTCHSFNGNIANFYTTRTTSGNSLFYQNFVMNQDLSTKFISAAASPTGSSYVAWDVSNFTTFQSIFSGCSVFNTSISNWNIGGNSSPGDIISFSNLFSNAFEFDQDISTKFISAAASPTNVAYTAWDTSKVTNMGLMLYSARNFGTIGDISNWNTSNVTTFSNFSNYSNYFNNDLSTKSVIVNGVTYTAWDVSSCLDFRSMFFDADAFSKNLRSWNLNPNITNVSKMFRGPNNVAVGMSVANYTDTIVGWAIKHTQGTYNPNNLDFNTATDNQPGFETGRRSNVDNNNTITLYSVLYGTAWGNTGWTDAGDAADYLKKSTGEGGAGWQDFESKRV